MDEKEIKHMPFKALKKDIQLRGKLKFVGNINDIFVGVWKSSDNDSDVRIAITKENSQYFNLYAYDVSDGERLEIQNVKITKKTLKFECRVPSNDYRTICSLKIVCPGLIELKLTIFEEWVHDAEAEKIY